MALLASDFNRSRFLKAEDLDGNKRAKIKAVTDEAVGESRERKLIVWFTNTDRGLVLNLTNLRALQGAFGDDTAGWVGKVIELFKIFTDFRGRTMPAIRVSIPPPNGDGSAARPSTPPAPPAPKPVEQPPPAARPTLADEMNDEIPW